MPPLPHSNTNPNHCKTHHHLLLFGLLLGITLHFLLVPHPSSPLEQCNIKPSILEMDWSPNAFVNAAATHQPVLFRGIPQWGATNWTWDYLKGHLKQVKIDVETSHSPNFFYYDHGDDNLLSEKSWLNSNVHDAMEKEQRNRHSQTMSFQTFLNAIQQPIVINAKNNQRDLETSFFYLTRTVKAVTATNDDEEENEGEDDEDDKKFRSLLAPHFQPMDPFPFYFTNDTLKSTLTLWMGGPRGITTQSHYDEPHNMFVQLLGSKTFTLIPPCAMDGLYLYPDLHQRARKVQVPLNKISTLQELIGFSFPLFQKYILGGRSTDSVDPYLSHVTVRPGDILYLPPFWMHRVSVASSGGAASANIFVPSRVTELKNRLMQSPLPFQQKWIRSSMSPTVVHRWLSLIMKRLHLSLRVMSQRLLHVRYVHMQLHSKYTYHWNERAKQCVRNDGELISLTTTTMEQTDNLFPWANHVSKFETIASQIDPAVLWQMMQSYVELLMYNIMEGGIDELKSFLTGCVLV